MFKYGVLYFLVDLVSKASAFLILPIITGALSVENYGLYGLSSAVITGLLVGSAIGVDAVYARMLYEPRIDKSELFFTAVSLNVRVAIVFAVLAVGLLYLTYFSVVQSLLIAASFLTTSVLMYPRTYFVVKEQSKWFAIYSVTQLGSFLGLIGVLYLIDEITLTSVLSASLCCQLSAAIVAYALFFGVAGNVWLPNRNLRILVRLRKYGKQIYVTSLLSYALGNLDRYTIALLASKTQLGVYAFSLALAGIVKTTGTSIIFSLQPRVYAMLVKGETSKIEKVYFVLAIAAPLMFVLFALLIRFLLPFFRQEYGSSYQLIVILALGGICEIFYQLVTIFFQFRYNAKAIFDVESFAAIAQLFILPTALYLGGMWWMTISVGFISFTKLLGLDFLKARSSPDSYLGTATRFYRIMSVISCGVVCLVLIQ